jgi:hypothetical protein
MANALPVFHQTGDSFELLMTRLPALRIDPDHLTLFSDGR